MFFNANYTRPIISCPLTQARGMSGELIVSVDMVPSLLHLGLGPLAQAVCSLASRRRGGEIVATVLGTTMGALQSARADIEASYGASLSGFGAVFA